MATSILHSIENTLVNTSVQVGLYVAERASNALHLAATTGHASIVQMIIALPDFDDREALQDAFTKASEKGHVEVMRALLNDGRIDPSARTCAALQTASSSGHAEAVALLLEDPRVDPSILKNYPIRVAALGGHVESIKLLLKHPKVYPAARVNHAIRIAAAKGHTEAVRVLLQDQRVDPGAHGNYALNMAAFHGHTDVVQLLLEDPRVDPRDNKCYALSASLKFAHRDAIRLILSHPDALISSEVQNEMKKVSIDVLEVVFRSTFIVPSLLGDGSAHDAEAIEALKDRICRDRVDHCLTMSRLPVPDGVAGRIAWFAYGKTGTITAANTQKEDFLSRVGRLVSLIRLQRVLNEDTDARNEL